MAVTQVILDDVTGEGAVVVEGPIVDHMACADPVVRKLVGVGETAWKGRRRMQKHEIYQSNLGIIEWKL